jgi:hypothetical protein
MQKCVPYSFSLVIAEGNPRTSFFFVIPEGNLRLVFGLS